MNQDCSADCQSFAKGARAMLNELAIYLEPEKRHEAEQWVLDVELWSDTCEMLPLPSDTE
jgi:hypothetical protein